MKTLLKSTLVVMAALVLSGQAFARQTSGNATVSANANIVASLTVANVADLSFGDILTSGTPTITATTTGAGSVSVTGVTPSNVMNVSILYPSVLTDGTPANDLTFATYSAAVTATGNDADPTNAVALTGEAASGQTITGTYTSTDGTVAHIFVGGQITSASNGVAGNTYANDITVTVDYN
tara:strand:+ start:5293 stop:5835 length:543 start_codon:yes stop_codon:yes gene_type:complete